MPARSEPGHEALADPGRLAALQRAGLLDTVPEEAFDRFTRLAVRVLGVPTALVSLVDDRRQFFKSCVGLPQPYATTRETPLSHSFCQYTVVRRSPLIIRDARTHPLVSGNGAIADLGVIAYAGMPLTTRDGHVLGSFCAIDTEPRDWSEADLATLRDLADGVVTEIELRNANTEAIRLLATVERERADMAVLLDSTAEGICGIDAQGGCTFLNACAGRLLGYEAAEVLGRNMHALIHHTRADGSSYPEEECPIAQAVSRGEGVRLFKEMLWRRDGSSFLAEYSAQPVVREGSVTGAVISFLDVTARDEAERRLSVQYAVASILATSQELDQALPRLLETIGGGLGWEVGLFWQVDGDVLGCEQVWSATTVAAAEFIEASRRARVKRGRGLVGAVWARREPVWVTDLQDEPRYARIRVAKQEGLGGALAFPIQSGAQTHGVLEFLSHDRRPPDAELLRTLTVIGYQVGQFFARMRVEEGLRVANRAIASASSGITISDASHDDLPIVYVNPAFTTITGYASEEVIGRNCRFLQGADTDPADVARIRAAIAERSQCCVELLNYRADGSAFWNELTLSPVTDTTGAVTHYIGLQADITARKRIERELAEARQASEAANLAKSRFLANMSHELRTPLNAIILYSELLQEEAEDRNVSEFVPDLEKIRRADRHLLSLINGVLDLAKIEAGKTELYQETVDVAETIQDVVATAMPLLEKNRNALEVQVAAEVGTMHADETKLRQILFNLLSNAGKFTSDGRIVLRVSRESTRDGERLVLRVRDTGIGMTPEQVAKLFQPFSQADQSVTRKYGGTGLGLAICAQFAELMGGSIAVASEADVGTEFTVSLPMGTAPPASTAPALTDDVPVEGYALVIDHELAARDALTHALTTQGIPTLAAADGADGLRLARTVRPGIIFLDAVMPQVDGWQVLTTLKADPALAEVPVVMMTISPADGLGYLLGAADYLVKPIDHERLLGLLRKFGSRRAHGSVLVIDDDDATRAAVEKLLVREGWGVVEAQDGWAGLERMATGSVAVVLLDLIMPGMDGFEFLAALRAHPEWRTVPVLVMTSKDLTREDRVRLSGSVETIIKKGAHTREEVLKQVRDIAQRYALRPLGATPVGVTSVHSEE